MAPHQPEKTYQGQTLQLIMLDQKVTKKKIVFKFETWISFIKMSFFHWCGKITLSVCRPVFVSVKFLQESLIFVSPSQSYWKLYQPEKNLPRTNTLAYCASAKSAEVKDSFKVGKLNQLFKDVFLSLMLWQNKLECIWYCTNQKKVTKGKRSSLLCFAKMWRRKRKFLRLRPES